MLCAAQLSWSPATRRFLITLLSAKQRAAATTPYQPRIERAQTAHQMEISGCLKTNTRTPRIHFYVNRCQVLGVIITLL
jgi:hypothetical protein